MQIITIEILAKNCSAPSDLKHPGAMRFLVGYFVGMRLEIEVGLKDSSCHIPHACKHTNIRDGKTLLMAIV